MNILTGFLVLFGVLGVSSALFVVLIWLSVRDVLFCVIQIMDRNEVCSPGVKQRSKK